MGFHATDELEAVLESHQENLTPPSKNRAWNFFTTSETCTGFFESQPVEPHWEKLPTPTKPVSGMRFYGYRYYSADSGRWVNRDPINEPGHKLTRGVKQRRDVDGDIIDDTRLSEERNVLLYISNKPIDGFDGLGLAHYSKCCNTSSGDEWALIGGVWTLLTPGACAGGWSPNNDCDGMTRGGGFYAVYVGWATCAHPGCDQWPFNNGRRWTPGTTNPNPPAVPPLGRGAPSNIPGGYSYGPPPPCCP